MAQAPDPKEPAGLCSIARAALICSCSRDAIRKRIGSANLQPVADDGRGNALYRIFDVVRAFLGVEGSEAKEGKPADPEKMSGPDRNAWYQAEGRKLDLLERMSKLVPIELWQREADTVYRELAQFLETLPDVLERDAHLDAQTVELLNESVRRYRAKLAEELIARRVPQQKAATA